VSSTEPHPPGNSRDLAPAKPTLPGESAAAGHETAAPPAAAPASEPPRTRVSAAFSGAIAGAIVLILLLIFILENTKSVKVSYFGAGGHLALGVALLLAAVGGGLLVGLLGAARIAQVRRHAKRRGRLTGH
jgi:uncharacterized integral membrane protein